jgi:hypothetical protein
MALLAADFGRHSRTRRDLLLVGIAGLAAPLTVTLFAASMIQQAAYHWRADLGSLANIALALWGGDSGHYVFQWMSLAVITMFGYARFGVYICRSALVPANSRRTRLLVLALICSVAIVSSATESVLITRFLELSARIAAATAAILSADYLARNWRTRAKKRVDWPSLLVFLAGFVAGGPLQFWTGADYHSDLTASILKPYAASFALCLITRATQRWTNFGSVSAGS